MRFVLTVDMDALGAGELDAQQELGRILRYWAANTRLYAAEPGVGEDISDSTYAVVGRWEYQGAATAAADDDAGTLQQG